MRRTIVWAMAALAGAILPAWAGDSAPAAAGAGGQATASNAAAVQLATAPVQAGEARASAAFDGVVEAVRQTVLAAQVPGAVVAVEVRAGDTVRAGQTLVRIDARAAEQNAAAGDAQVRAARAAQEVATREYERQRQLHEKRYISQGALERAEAQYKATQAQVQAQLAQAEAARTQTGFHVVRAPYAGVVSEVPVVLGDMAMPGKPLVTMHDPAALRVTVAVPQGVVAALGGDDTTARRAVRIELPGLPGGERFVQPVRVQVLPTVDPGTHTVQLRLELPAATKAASPGTFARVWVESAARDDAGGAQATARLFVPAAALVRRAEMTGVYVIDAQGRALLRQVRVGRRVDERVEILAGVSEGERVALDPQAAARAR